MLSIGDLMAIGSKGLDLVKTTNLPVFERAEYGGVLPEAVALPMGIEDLTDDDAASDFEALVRLKDSPENAWCHELRLRMWIRNTSSRLLSIVGIAPNKRVLDLEYGSAIMFPPQGSIGGDVVRFECDLDKDAPSMRRFNLEGIQRTYTSGEYYFEEGMLEIDPGHAICVSALFIAKDKVYEVAPEIIVKLSGSIEAVPVPTCRRGIVCPSGLIPDEAKMVRTFSGRPPFFENDPVRFQAYLRY